MNQSRKESVEMAKLSAVCLYLKELQKKNLVAPSICLLSLPYPDVPINDEKLKVHSINLNSQAETIRELEDQIKTLRSRSVNVCEKMFADHCYKLKKKRLYLEKKYLPTNGTDSYIIKSSVVSTNDNYPSESRSEHLAVLVAKYFYLNELHKANLVTPSIALPYPKHPATEDDLLIHSVHRRIQLKRMISIRCEIDKLRGQDVSPCLITLHTGKRRLWKKVLFLKNKFKPDRPRHHKQCKNKYSDVKLKNKRSRERYRVRKYKKKLREYGSSACNRNVINLSSIDLPTSDLFALELGHGFVLTPNNLMKAEETLILEGFRFFRQAWQS